MTSHDSIPLYSLDSDEDGLDRRQLEVLSVLSEDEGTVYSFQGLRRKLGLHQEMLSRTLDRLEDQAFIVKTNDGYRVNPNKCTSQFEFDVEMTPNETEVVTARLPIEVNTSLVLNALKGRWFREFRWLGYSDAQAQLTMSWISENGEIQLRVRILNSNLAISAIYPSDANREKATASAFELFNFVNRAMKKKLTPFKHQVPN
jgi:predicted transcriptional regulator